MVVNGVNLDSTKIQLTNEAYNYIKETTESIKSIYLKREEANLVDAVLIDCEDSIAEHKHKVQQARHIISELDAMLNTLIAYRVQD